MSRLTGFLEIGSAVTSGNLSSNNFPSKSVNEVTHAKEYFCSPGQARSLVREVSGESGKREKSGISGGFSVHFSTEIL
ncbi:hypothetical protein NPIL_12981 [Nephila pilipes]|uniref:Uncharacterized protein n=1 Tax=Nephila pilipes TaxID=299642 RepID=A0A8X6NCI6_NEPPI|nr:hypothetical protein NPIL_12981 [Nephila pilipes]